MLPPPGAMAQGQPQMLTPEQMMMIQQQQMLQQQANAYDPRGINPNSDPRWASMNNNHPRPGYPAHPKMTTKLKIKWSLIGAGILAGIVLVYMSGIIPGIAGVFGYDMPRLVLKF